MQNNKLISDEEAVALIKGIILSFMADIVDVEGLSTKTANTLRELAEELESTLNDLAMKYADIHQEAQVKKFLYLIETAEEWYLQSKDLEE